MDAVTLALAKKHVEKTLSGIGPIKGETGNAGPAGPKGPTGDAGIKGDPGEPGPKGPTGDAGPAGPKGDTGDVGPIGPKGPDGEAGPAGANGLKGVTGPKGPDGAQGPQGENGPKGEPFLIKKVYATVSDMNAGYATDGVAVGELVAINSNTGGSDGGHLYKKDSKQYEFFYDIGTVSGLAGPAGPAGPDGPVGGKGIPGVDGSKGETGDKGLVGTKGPKGDTGDMGLKGAKGDTGAAGAQGSKGETGDVGPKGPKGDSGADGPKGEHGDPGVPVTINGQAAKIIQAGSNITIDKTGKILTINAANGGGGTGGMYPVVVITTEPATAGVTFTVTNGKSAFTGTTDDTGTVEIEFDDIGAWTISATIEGRTLKQTLYADTVKIYNVTFKITVSKIYGVEWDGTATTKWARTDSAATFTDPVPYAAGATEYGSPFDNISPWKDMVIEERTCGTMVKIPKFYYKLLQSGAGLKIQISDSPFDGATVSPAHVDRGDGKGERDFIYIGRYHCSESDYKSKRGEKPKRYISRYTFGEKVREIGENIFLTDWMTRTTIWLLYLVEFANWDSQTAIGYGCGDGVAVGSMGYTDSMPYHTGTTQGNRTTYGLGTQYRNIEGLWDNVWDWLDGCYYSDDGNMYIILDPNEARGRVGGVSVGPAVQGYPGKISVESPYGINILMGKATGGSEKSYTCDYWSYKAVSADICTGAKWAHYQSYGLFNINYFSATLGNDSVGARILELP